MSKQVELHNWGVDVKKYIYLWADSAKDVKISGYEKCLETDYINNGFSQTNETIIRVTNVSPNDGTISYYTQTCTRTFIDTMEKIYVQAKHINANEVILGWMKQKPRVDIDQKGCTDSTLANSIYEKFITALIKWYKLEDDANFAGICVDAYDSSDDKKLSRHLVARELCWANCWEGKYFMDKCLKPTLTAEELKIVDFGIYSKTAGLRTIYSTKEGRRKVLLKAGELTNTNDEWTPIDSLITHVENCQVLPALLKPNVVDQDKQYGPAIQDAKTKDIIEKFAESNGLSAVQQNSCTTRIILSRSRPANCPVCNRQHEKVGGFITIHKYAIKYYCYRACAENKDPSSKVIFEILRPTIYSHPTDFPHKFFDYMKCPLEKLGQFVRKNVAYIDDGGEPYYITRGIVDNDICFRMVKDRNLAKIPRIWELPNGKPLMLLTAINNEVEKISYERADFMPPHLGPINNVFNTFTGFKHKVLDKFDPAIIAPVLNHIREVWCRNVQDQYDYIINLFAHIVQKPHIKADTAVIIKSSEQGAGKGIIVDFLGDKVIGSKYYYYTENVGKLFDKFNSEQANKILTLVDETSASEKSTKDISEELKAHITRKKLWVEHKGVNKIELNDYNNYIFATNRECPLYVDTHDRRFFILDADNKYCTDKDYFAKLAEAMTDECGQHFYTMLMKRDITTFNPRKRPQTEAKNKMIEDSLPLYMKFIVDYVRNNEFERLSVSSDDLYNVFKGWCSDCNIRNTPSKIGFSRDINKIIPVKHVKRNGIKTNMRDISMIDLRANIRRACNFDIELVSSDEDNTNTAINTTANTVINTNTTAKDDEDDEWLDI